MHESYPGVGTGLLLLQERSVWAASHLKALVPADFPAELWVQEPHYLYAPPYQCFLREGIAELATVAQGF